MLCLRLKSSLCMQLCALYFRHDVIRLSWRRSWQYAPSALNVNVKNFKKARVNGGTDNHSLKNCHKSLRCRWQTASYGNQTISSTRPSCWIQISTVDVIYIAADHQMFMTLTGELSRQRLRRSAVDFYSKKKTKNRSLSHPFWTKG